MSKNQIMIIIFATIGFLLMFSAGIYLLYLFAPQTLGLPPKSEHRASYKDIKPYIDPKISISKQQYDEWQKKVLDAEIKQNDNSFLVKENKLLTDSLKKFSNSLININRTDKKTPDNLPSANNDGKKPSDSSNTVNVQINNLKNEITSLNTTIANLKKYNQIKEDSLYENNLKDFAKIYENSSPEEIAKILEKLNNFKDAAKILKIMSKKKAGKIIELWKPEQAANILRNGGSK